MSNNIQIPLCLSLKYKHPSLETEYKECFQAGVPMIIISESVSFDLTSGKYNKSTSIDKICRSNPKHEHKMAKLKNELEILNKKSEIKLRDISIIGAEYKNLINMYGLADIKGNNEEREIIRKKIRENEMKKDELSKELSIISTQILSAQSKIIMENYDNKNHDDQPYEELTGEEILENYRREVLIGEDYEQ